MARIASTTTSGMPVGNRSDMTLDALMARQKLLATQASQMNQPRQMISPWQGAALLGEALSNKIAQARNDKQMTSGRDALAQIRAGIDLEAGPTSEQISQASIYDPDYADRLTQMAAQAIQARRTMEAANANREDQQEFTASQQTGQQEFTAGQNEAQRNAAIEAAKLKASEPGSPEGKIMADFEAGAYGDPTTPEAAALRDAAIKKETSIPQIGGTAADRKAMWGEQDAYINTASSADQLRRARDLLTEGVNTGYTAGLRTMYDVAGGPGGDEAMGNRTKEYNSIMNHEAILAMSNALKGATTDTEMNKFIEIMNDPTIDPMVKARQINVMLARVDAFQKLQGERITTLGGTVPELQRPEAAPPPSPDAGAAPAPSQYEVGKTYTFDEGTFVFKGGDSTKAESWQPVSGGP